MANTSLASNTFVAGGNINVNTHGNLTEDVSNWLAKIARVNQYAIHQEALEQIAPGTCSWILEDQRFGDWRSRESGVFWGVGMPGAGKTTLSSFVIKHLQQQATIMGNQAYVVFAYSRYNDKLSTAEVLAAILQQLSVYSESIRSRLRETLYKTCQQQSRSPGESELQAALQASIELTTKVFIVVDALDELEESCREKILSIIVSWSQPVFVTSRPLSLYLDCMERPSIEIRAPEHDFRIFIESEIKKLPKLRSLLKNRRVVMEDVITSMIDKSDGMILLCALQLRCLADVTTVKSLKESIGRLPTTLDDMYHLTLTRILAQGEEAAQLALRVFLWVAYAARPLEVYELLHVLAMEPGSDELDNDATTTGDTLLSVCGGLISIHEEEEEEEEDDDQDSEGIGEADDECNGEGRETGTVRFMHYTTHDFFSNYPQKPFDDPHTFIADSCATYWKVVCASHTPGEISHEYFEYGKYGKYSMNMDHRFSCKCHGFACYAHYFLNDHMLESIRWHNGSISPCVQRILHPPESILFVRTEWFRNIPGCGPHFAAYYGLHSFFKNVTDAHMVEKCSCELEKAGYTLLMLACAGGNLGTIEWILKLFKEDLDVITKDEETALIFAIKSGRVEVVQALLKVGASVRTGSPLVVACSVGNAEITQILLANPDIEIHSMRGGSTPLHEAVAKGYIPIMRLLLSYPGADVNHPDAWGMTPLRSATTYGNHLAVQVLLETPGVKATCSQSSGLVMLADSDSGWSAPNGLLPIIKLFLEVPDFDFKATDEYGHTILHYCAQQSAYVDSLSVLLASSRVDINCRDKYGWTPLHWASYWGNKDCVQALLDNGNGLDINAVSISQTEPTELFLLLRDKSPDWVFPKNNRGVWPSATALDLARKKEYETIVKVLIGYGAKSATELI